MLAQERQQRITELLQKNGFVKVSDLSRQFNVSMETIRRDMDALESQGILKKTHGGAMLDDGVRSVPPISQRLTINAQKKEEIAHLAVSLINEDDSVIFDSGTTTMAIARAITNISIKVITNDIHVADELAAKDKIDLMVTGGTLLKGSYSLVGPECTSAFQRINADKLLLAASGVDILSGLTVSNALEAEAKRHMIASAKEIILVADSSKFGKRSLISYAPLSAVNMIITNGDIPHDVEDAITEMGIRLYKT
ncbi:MAG: hypothetical protein PWP48_273 [Clostridiales bacterium]|nr:hypothetical protein [Clostridiales bacterium]